jgi:hypothetical protein
MNTIITVLAAVTFSYYFVEVMAVYKIIKRFYDFAPGRRLKPLDCVSCLSVWSCLVLLILPNEVSVWIAALFTAGYIGRKIK